MSVERRDAMVEDWEEADGALAAFKSWIPNQIRRDFEAVGSATEYKAKIYHYTDDKGALGIIKSGHLWFTERAHLNDSSEIRHGVTIAYSVLDAAAKRRGGAIPQETAVHLKGEHDFSLLTYGFWVASFSFNGDDLNQWRSYADDARGVSLEFSTEQFDMAKVAQLLAGEPNSLRFPVSYDDGRLRSRVKPYVVRGLDVLEVAELSLRGTYREPFGRALLFERDLFRAMNNGIFANSVLHKHPAYVGEQEYRLLISGPRETITKSSFHHTRKRESESVSYLNLPIPNWGQREVLTLVRLGPAAHRDLGDEIYAALMASDNPMPRIERSHIPYRSTRPSPSNRGLR